MLTDSIPFAGLPFSQVSFPRKLRLQYASMLAASTSRTASLESLDACVTAPALARDAPARRIIIEPSFLIL